MGHVEYLINNVAYWSKKSQNNQDCELGYYYIESIFSSVFNRSETLFQNHIDKLETQLEKLNFLTFEDYYDESILDIVESQRQEFRIEHEIEIKDYGLKSKLYEIEKWYKLNTGFYQIVNEETLP